MSKFIEPKAPRMFDTSTLRGRLRTLMYRSDVRQKKVAEDIGVTPTAVTRWLKHDGGIKYEHAQALGKYFGVPASWIMEGGELNELQSFKGEVKTTSKTETKAKASNAIPLCEYGAKGWETLPADLAMGFPEAFFIRHNVKPSECARVCVRETSQFSPFKQWDVVTVKKETDTNPQTAQVLGGNFYLVEVDGSGQVVKLRKTRTDLIFEGATPELTETFPLEGLTGVSLLGRILHLEREIFSF